MKLYKIFEDWLDGYDVGCLLTEHGIRYTVQTITDYEEVFDLNWMVTRTPKEVTIYIARMPEEYLSVIMLRFPGIRIKEVPPSEPIDKMVKRFRRKIDVDTSS